MPLLELQDLEDIDREAGGESHGGSSGSGHSCPSDLSATLCDGTSALSLLLCH
jgi:hypothetical protein